MNNEEEYIIYWFVEIDVGYRIKLYVYNYIIYYIIDVGYKD